MGTVILVVGWVILVVGWVLWGFALLFGLLCLAIGNPDGGVRFMMQMMGSTLLAACAVTAFFPVSKLWLLAAFPVAFFLPMLFMLTRAAAARARFARLMIESEVTGVDIVDLMKRENERMQGRSKESEQEEPEKEQLTPDELEEHKRRLEFMESHQDLIKAKLFEYLEEHPDADDIPDYETKYIINKCFLDHEIARLEDEIDGVKGEVVEYMDGLRAKRDN